MLKFVFKAALENKVVRDCLENIGSWYLYGVVKSCALIIYPRELYGRADRYWPCILATWHGKSYVLPFALRPPDQVRVLVSNHADGQIFARTVRRLGFEIVVGSGAGPSRQDMMQKRSVAAFREMLRSLRANCSVALTADVPKVAGVAGLGIVKLARHSRRPIVPVGIMTSHRCVLRNWDQTVINGPFGRLAIVVGEPIFVEDSNDSTMLENKRLEIERALNSVNAEATKLADYRRFWSFGNTQP